MTADIKRYKKALKRALPYGRSLRKRLMESFHFSLMTFMEEESDPDMRSLYTAFGPPSEMAKLLTAALTEEDIRRSRKQKITARIFAGVGIVVAALLLATVAFSIMFYHQPITVIEQNIDHGTICPSTIEDTLP